MLHGLKMSILTQVKVSISKNSENHELQLTVEPPLSTQSLSLKQGQFDVEKIKLSQGVFIKGFESMGAVNSDCIMFAIPDVAGTIILKPDGSLIIEHMNSESGVELNIAGTITVNGPVHTKSLTLKAKKIDINHLVLAEDGLNLQADELLQNSQTLESNHIRIKGQGQFKNLGLVSAAKKLELDIRTVDNGGVLLASDIQANVKHKDPDIYFNNAGILFGKKHLSLNIFGRITNQGAGEILSDGRVSIRTMSSFHNTAKVYAKEDLVVSGDKLVNSGLLAAEQLVQLASEKTIRNGGRVQSCQDMRVHSHDKLDNQAQGVFVAEKTLEMRSAKDFFNEGIIAGKQSVLISSPSPIRNRKTARILSDAIVAFQGAGEIRNHGEITGHLSVTTQTIGDTYNGKYAKIAGEKLDLSTLNEFYNKGDAVAEESLKLRAGSLRNETEARLGSHGNAQLDVRNAVTNGGNLFAQNLVVQAESLINQVRTGEIASLETLTLKIKKQLINAHRIKAERNIDIAARELSNEESASIEGNKKVRISAEKIDNRGKIVSHQLFLQVAKRFCNDPKAQLAAKQCLALISRGSVENQGEVSSEGTILLKAVEQLVNRLEGHIEAGEWARLISAHEIENAATLIAHGDLIINALSEFANLVDGIAKGENVNVKANTVRNNGLLQASKTVKIEAKLILENLLKGIILAGERLALFSKSILENAGTLASRGSLVLKANEILKNLHEGRVIADEDLQLLAGHVLSNAGHLFSHKDALIKSGHWFTNGLEASLHAEGNLAVEADYRADNKGVMEATGALTFKALKVLGNYQNGVLNAEGALSVIAEVVDNWGQMDSENTLTIESKLILSNYRTGKLSSKEALQLYSACIVRNAGSIESSESITVKADTLLQTLAESKIESETQLTLLSQFALENAGALSANRIRLEANALFKNELTGEAVAGTVLEASAQFATNAGSLHSKDNLTHRGEALWNFSTGKITAEKVLSIFLTGHGENQGLVAGEDVQLEAQSLINQGIITSLKSLSLKVQETFKHCREGKLAAREAIVVLAKDLQLMGQLMAAGNFTAIIERDFEYNTETLWAVGLIKLMLQRGYNFTKPINTPGSLSLETPVDLVIRTQVQTGQNFSATARHFSTFTGGVFAGESLTVKASQNVQVGQAVPGTQKPLVSDGAYLASQGSMHLEGSVVRNTLGEIYTNDNLILQALQLIENSGNVTVGGSAQVISPLFKHQLLTQQYHNSARALSAAPRWIASGGSAFSVSLVDILGGHMHVGGTLSQIPGGSFLARSFEEFREWTDAYRVKGKRKKWYKGGGHHFYTQYIHRHQTTGIYDSHISAGKAVHLNNINCLDNQGAFRTPNFTASFQTFHNGNTFTTPFEASFFKERTELRKYFRESALFGRVDTDSYVYAPKVPFTFNLPLMPPVHLDSHLRAPNAGNLYTFAPMIEKDLVQQALQALLRTGYIDESAGSPEAVFAQLRKNANDYFVGPTLQVSETQYCTVDPVSEDGDCLFESCLRALKTLSSTHSAHAIPNNQALRAMVLETLPTRIEDIRARVYAVLTGAMPIDMFQPGPFAEKLWSEHQRYIYIRETLGVEAAEDALDAYLREVPTDYIANMRESGTWGGDIELGIIAQRFNVNIRVHHAANTIVGYQYRYAQEIGNDPTRPTIDILYSGNHYDNLKPKVTIPTTEANLQAAPKAMLVYQMQDSEGKPTYMPILFIPEVVRNAIGTGRPDQAVVQARDAELSGKLLHNTGRFQVDEHLKMEIDSIVVQQKQYIEYQKVRRNRKQGYIHVPVQKAVDDTGVLYAGTMTGKLHTFQQIGGHVHSGIGGTHLEIRDDALVQALMTTEAVQGPISRKGRNYQIEPVFIPAKITSNGNQTIIVTEGGFTAEGILSSAGGKNTLEALKDIQIRNIKASFELASQKRRSGFMGSKRTETGGSSFSNLESAFLGGEGIAMTSQEGMVRLVNIILLSGGDATLKAKRMVSILNDTAQTSSYAKRNGFKGFSYNKQSMHQSNTHSLGSQAFISGNFNITAEEEVRLRHLTGVIQDDMSLQALHVILEGAMERSTTTHKIKSLGVSFFGSSSLEALMAGKNGKAAMQQLLREDSFANVLERLNHPTDGGDATIQAVQTLIEGWRLVTMIAEACDRPTSCGSQDVLGSLTDRWGLTTPTKDAAGNITGHTFNPRFTFSFNQSKSTTTKTRMVPTTLMIGGNLHVVADVIQLHDGTKIEAENIQLHARKLLEIRAAQNTESTNSRQNGGSVSFHLNGDFTGASAHKSKYHSETIQYQNACLKARNLLSILNEGKTTIQGAELEAREVMIRTGELLLESLQDTHHASGYSHSVSVDPEGHGSIQFGREFAYKAWVNHPTFIKAERNLDIFVDYLIQKGSLLSSDQKLRVHGLTHGTPLQWIHEDIQDFQSSRKTNVNLAYKDKNDSFPLIGALHRASRKKEGVTRASIAALDLAGYMPSSINRNLKRVQETLSGRHHSTGVPIMVPNFEKLKKDAGSISKMLQGSNKKIPPPPPMQTETEKQRAVRKKAVEEKQAQEKVRQQKEKSKVADKKEENDTAQSRVWLPMTEVDSETLANDDYDKFMADSEPMTESQPKPQNCSDAYSEDLNASASDCLEIGFGAATRIVESTLESVAVHAASRFIPVVGPVVAGAELVCQAARMGVAAIDFETNYFLLTPEYEELMQNPFLSETKKAEITQDAIKRYEEASKQRTRSALQAIKENPQGFGVAVVDHGRSLFSAASGVRSILKSSVPPPPPAIKPTTTANTHTPSLKQSRSVPVSNSITHPTSNSERLNQVNQAFETKSLRDFPAEVPLSQGVLSAFRASKKCSNEETLQFRVNQQNSRLSVPPPPPPGTSATAASVFVSPLNQNCVVSNATAIASKLRGSKPPIPPPPPPCEVRLNQRLETLHAFRQHLHGDVVCLNADQIKFCQSSVKGVESITTEMSSYGWTANTPVDVVRLSDGTLITVDNTRVLAASRAGIQVRAKIHESHEPLTEKLKQRFTTERDGIPSNWGEAIQFRLNKQNATYREHNPAGSHHVGSMW